MTRPASHFVRLAIAATLGTTLAACASSPTPSYYLLRPPAFEPTVTEQTEITILIQSVTIPDHLRRQEMVLGPIDGPVSFTTTERWAEPLDKNISEFLAARLGSQFGTANVFDRWSGFTTKPKIVVRLDITRFGTSGQEAAIDASWELSGTQSTAVVRFSDQARASISGPSAAERVRGMEAALADLGTKISTSIADRLRRRED